MRCPPWDHRGHSSATRAATTVWLTLLVLLERITNRCGCSSRASAGPIAVEIGRRSTAAGAVPMESRRRLNGDAGAIALINCENAEYSGKIGLGTPVQEFEVVLDTGSYALWVTSVSCVEGCESNNKYDASLSTSYVEDGTVFTQSYEDGSEARGVLSVDTLSVGGLTTTATFGEMSTRSLDGCADVDGILGMGLSSEGDRQSVFEDLVHAGVVDIPIFSFFMGDIDSDTPMGVLTLGGVNQTHYDGCLEWIGVSRGAPDGFWAVVLQDLKIGADSAIRSSAPAILDTGTSMIVGPFEDVGYIAASIGGFCVTLAASSETIEIDCEQDAQDVELILMTCDSTFQDINFSFGGDDFILTPKELLIPLSDFGPAAPSTAAEPWCIFGMLGHDQNMWILGDSFLRTFYTAFDVAEKKVGLARATGQRVGNTCAADAAFSGDSGSDSDAAQPAPAPTTGTSTTDEPVQPPLTPAPSVIAADQASPDDESSTESGEGESHEMRDDGVNGG